LKNVIWRPTPTLYRCEPRGRDGKPKGTLHRGGGQGTITRLLVVVQCNRFFAGGRTMTRNLWHRWMRQPVRLNGAIHDRAWGNRLELKKTTEEEKGRSVLNVRKNGGGTQRKTSWFLWGFVLATAEKTKGAKRKPGITEDQGIMLGPPRVLPGEPGAVSGQLDTPVWEVWGADWATGEQKPSRGPG